MLTSLSHLDPFEPHFFAGVCVGWVDTLVIDSPQFEEAQIEYPQSNCFASGPVLIPAFISLIVPMLFRFPISATV